MQLVYYRIRETTQGGTDADGVIRGTTHLTISGYAIELAPGVLLRDEKGSVILLEGTRVSDKQLSENA